MAAEKQEVDYDDKDVSHYPSVLVLAGIELNFFIVACMGLCFGFVLKTVLVIQGCFSYC